MQRPTEKTLLYKQDHIAQLSSLISLLNLGFAGSIFLWLGVKYLIWTSRAEIENTDVARQFNIPQAETLRHCVLQGMLMLGTIVGKKAYFLPILRWIHQQLNKAPHQTPTATELKSKKDNVHCKAVRNNRVFWIKRVPTPLQLARKISKRMYAGAIFHLLGLKDLKLNQRSETNETDMSNNLNIRKTETLRHWVFQFILMLGTTAGKKAMVLFPVLRWTNQQINRALHQVLIATELKPQKGNTQLEARRNNHVFLIKRATQPLQLARKISKILTCCCLTGLACILKKEQKLRHPYTKLKWFFAAASRQPDTINLDEHKKLQIKLCQVSTRPVTGTTTARQPINKNSDPAQPTTNLAQISDNTNAKKQQGQNKGDIDARQTSERNQTRAIRPLNSLSIIKIALINIRKLTQVKFKALLELEEAKDTDIFLRTETKAKEEDGFAYMKTLGWEMQNVIPTANGSNTRHGGIAMLFRRDTFNIVSTHIPNNSQNMCTWQIQNAGWKKSIALSLVYWPEPDVTLPNTHTEKDHITHFQRIITHNKTLNCPSFIFGDFNCHLGTIQDTFLTDEQKETWGNRIGATMPQNRAHTATENRLWTALQDSEMVVASSRTTSTNKIPYTRYPPTPIKQIQTKVQEPTLIDFVFAPLQYMDQVTKCEPILDSHIAVNSDHEVILTQLQIPNSIDIQEDPHQDQEGVDFNIKKLQKPEIAKAYKLALTNSLPRFQTAVKRRWHVHPADATEIQKDLLLNTLLQQLTANFSTTAINVLGTHKTGIPPKPWQAAHPPTRIHDEVFLHLKEKNKQAQQALKQARINGATEQDICVQQTLAKKARSKFMQRHAFILHQNSVHKLEKFSLDLNFNNKEENQNIWKHIAAINRQFSPMTGLPKRMKNLAGVMQKTNHDSAKCWHESRAEISAENDKTSSVYHQKLWQKWSKVEGNLMDSQKTEDKLNQKIYNQQITIEEIHNVIKSLKSGVSPGQDNLHNQLLKQGGLIAAQLIHPVFEIIWKLEKQPTAWDRCQMRMIFKKGDIHMCKQYRGIVLISTLNKIFEAVLKQRLQKHIDDTGTLSPLQHGYKQNTSGTEAIYTLTSIIQRRWKRESKQTYCAFIDFVTAFPSTCRPALWDASAKIGIRGKMWRMLHNLYTTPKCRVIHPDIPQNETFEIKKGLREGSRLSPLLYSIFIDTLVKKLQAENVGVKAEGCLNRSQKSHWMGSLLYADDIVLIADSAEELQKMLDITQTWAAENYAKISMEKTNIVAFHLPAVQQTTLINGTPQWHINDSTTDTLTKLPIKVVKSFTYLGVLLDYNLTFEAATKQCLQSFWNAHRKIQQYGAHKNGLNPVITIHLWKSMVLSKLTNTLPFIFRPTDIEHIQTNINRSLKYLFAPQSAEKAFMPRLLRAELGVPDVTTIRYQGLLRLYSHIHTIPFDRPASIIHRMQKYTATFSGTSQKGCIDDSIKSCLATLGLQQEWKTFMIPPQQQIPKIPRSYQKQAKAWMKAHTHTLTTYQTETFKTYLTKTDDTQGRKQKYFEHIFINSTAKPQGTGDQYKSQKKSLYRDNDNIFNPALYLQHACSSTAAYNMLMLRSQISLLPSHQPYLTTDQAQSNDSTPYLFRYCDYEQCSIPRAKTGLLHPNTIFPCGNEHHYVHVCPNHDSQRIHCEERMNAAMRRIPHKQLEKNYPWSSLSTHMQTATLLAATPPTEWELSKQETITWMQSTSPIIHDFWKQILKDRIKTLQHQDLLQLPHEQNEEMDNLWK